MKKTVVVTQLRLTHYRVPFFEALRRVLEERDVHLILVYGQPSPKDLTKNDSGDLAWATRVLNSYWKLGHTYLAWQPHVLVMRDADLIVITQESRILSNYFHLLRRKLFGSKIAFWGHGANLQSTNRNGLKETFKQWTANQVDWWFTYTKFSAPLISAACFPESRITILNNAIDTAELQKQSQSITQAEIMELSGKLNLKLGAVGIFVGSLYKEKRLDFIFSVAEAIRQAVPDFHLIIVGDGPEREIVRAWCETHTWGHWVGAQKGRDKVAHIALANVMLNPGALGLGVIDSFACQVPLITTDCGTHGPEIAYLVNGVNGLITPDRLDAYVNACLSLLSNADLLNSLRTGCGESAKEYTVENMARRFADGVVDAINFKNT